MPIKDNEGVKYAEIKDDSLLNWNKNVRAFMFT